MNTILNFDSLEHFLTDACEHYENSAPTVTEYCDSLYRRIHENPKSVSLLEILKITALLEEGIWEHPNFAANRVYHIMNELGLSTAGHAGF